MATFKVGVRRVNFTILELAAKVIRAETVETIMAASQTVSAVAKRVAFFYVVTCFTVPVAHFVVVFAPGVYGMIADGNLSPTSSFAFEVWGLVHVAVNATTDTGDGIGGSKSF